MALTCHPHLDAAERRAGDNLTTQHMQEHRADLKERRDRAYETAQRLEGIQSGGRTLTRNQAAELNVALGEVSAAGLAVEALSDQLVTLTTDRSGLIVPGQRETFRRGQLLRPEQRMADFAAARGLTGGDAGDLDFGVLLRGMNGLGWGPEGTNGREYRVLAEGAGSTGGFLVPDITSAALLDKVRGKARVMEAGAATVALESDVQIVPRQVTDVTPVWHTENAAITESGPTFDAVTFTAQTLPVLCKASAEVVQDSKVDLHSVVVNFMTQAIALELDRVCLRGTGTPPEPRGIRAASGVGITPLAADGATPSASASASTWDALSVASRKIRLANFEPTAALASPRTTSELYSLRDTTGRYLVPPPDVQYPILDTTQQPVTEVQGTSGAVASSVTIGQWDELMVGIRLGIRLVTLDQLYAANYQVGWLAVIRADVQEAHAAAFEIVSGIL